MYTYISYNTQFVNVNYVHIYYRCDYIGFDRQPLHDLRLTSPTIIYDEYLGVRL